MYWGFRPERADEIRHERSDFEHSCFAISKIGGMVVNPVVFFKHHVFQIRSKALIQIINFYFYCKKKAPYQNWQKRL
jgi:hypothetical protein